jgi:CRP-like cAMP-binding protein
VLIREGDAGDRYYLVADGTVAVSQGGAAIRVLGRGEGFGEIALLRDVPRTATVTAVSDVDLYALSKHDFLTALTARHLAERLTSERLASTHAAAPAEA